MLHSLPQKTINVLYKTVFGKRYLLLAHFTIYILYYTGLQGGQPFDLRNSSSKFVVLLKKYFWIALSKAYTNYSYIYAMFKESYIK